MKRSTFFALLMVLALFAPLAGTASAQKRKQDSDNGQRETLARPMSEKERRRQEERRLAAQRAREAGADTESRVTPTRAL